MRKSTGTYPSLTVDTTAKRVVSHAGAMLLAATAGRVGLDRALPAALRPWMRPLAIHDPGKVLLDLAISVAIGGDCLPISPRSGPSRRCSVRWHRIRRCPG